MSHTNRTTRTPDKRGSRGRSLIGSIRTIRDLATQLGRARSTVADWTRADHWQVSRRAPWSDAELSAIREWIESHARDPDQGEPTPPPPEYLKWAKSAGFKTVTEYAKSLRERADQIERELKQPVGT